MKGGAISSHCFLETGSNQDIERITQLCANFNVISLEFDLFNLMVCYPKGYREFEYFKDCKFLSYSVILLAFSKGSLHILIINRFSVTFENENSGKIFA